MEKGKRQEKETKERKKKRKKENITGTKKRREIDLVDTKRSLPISPSNQQECNEHQKRAHKMQAAGIRSIFFVQGAFSFVSIACVNKKYVDTFIRR